MIPLDNAAATNGRNPMGLAALSAAPEEHLLINRNALCRKSCFKFADKAEQDAFADLWA
jgi:hypothetical protein